MGRTKQMIAVDWYGPFQLCGKPGDPPKDRLKQLEEVYVNSHQVETFEHPIIKANGIYMIIGRRRKWLSRLLFKKPELLYIGIVNDQLESVRTFEVRLSEHIKPPKIKKVNSKKFANGQLNANSGKKEKNIIYEIERDGVVDEIWLGLRESPSQMRIRHEKDGKRVDWNKWPIQTVENILLYLTQPSLNDKDKGPPTVGILVHNIFQRNGSQSRKGNSRNSARLPDFIDYDPTGESAVIFYKTQKEPELSKGDLMKYIIN